MWDTGVNKTAEVFTTGVSLDSAYAIHTVEGAPPEGEGGAPPGPSSGEMVLGAAMGLSIHKAEGIWPTSMQGACNVPGLFAAGDAMVSNLCGSAYGTDIAKHHVPPATTTTGWPGSC